MINLHGAGAALLLMGAASSMGAVPLIRGTGVIRHVIGGLLAYIAALAIPLGLTTWVGENWRAAAVSAFNPSPSAEALPQDIQAAIQAADAAQSAAADTADAAAEPSRQDLAGSSKR